MRESHKYLRSTDRALRAQTLETTAQSLQIEYAAHVRYCRYCKDFDPCEDGRWYKRRLTAYDRILG